MGIYINPGNEGFRTARRSRYVDKSGLIAVVNETLDTKDKLSCVSRPRRFGKSYAAKMLCAYYCKGCDSSALFDDLAIASMEGTAYREHLNRYDVIYLDISNIIGKKGLTQIVSFVTHVLMAELRELYPDAKDADALDDLLVNVADHTGNKFVMLIDEWDAPIRDSDSTPEIQKEYLEFLRSLFKSSGTTDKAFTAVYMTGILPIKKDGSQSAISEFNEYTILNPGPFAPYVGFTEEEVQTLCEESGMDFAEMKSWYDGYSFRDVDSVYNPNSVMEAIRNRRCESYWQMSSAADSLLGYISMDFDGIASSVGDLVADQSIPVEVDDFKNDPKLIHSSEDVFTLLIHFGYLSYDLDSGLAHIPNEEIRREFVRSMRNMPQPETIRRVKESDQLIKDTINMDAEAVAAQIEKVHREEWEPRHYNNEQALRGVIKLAYFCYRDNYMKMEELASGLGYADIAFLPRRGRDVPALVIELKWDETADTAIRQIKDKRYPDALRDCGAEILLVGISYNKEDPGKKHRCVIEAVRR